MKEKIIKNCDWIIEFCLYLLIFYLPFAKAGIEIFASIAILVWIIKNVTSHKLQVTSYLPATGLNKALGAFIIVNAVTMGTSLHFYLSIKAFFGKVLEYIILYFIVVETINNKRRLRNIFIMILVSSMLMVADAGVQYFKGTDFLRGFASSRLTASFAAANGFAGWLIVVIPIILMMLIDMQLIRSKIKKITLGGLVILLVICLGLTYSRGAWIGCVFGLGLIGYYLIKLLRYRDKTLLCLLMIICLVGISFILPLTMKERIKSLGDIKSNLYRLDLWRESLNIIEDFPILGSGLNTYTTIAHYYKIQNEGGIYPHNSFLQMAAETGILGLFCFLWIVVELFKLGIQTLRRGKDILLLGILAGILGFLVQSFFDTNLYALQLAVLFWFMMGLAIAKTKIGIT